MHPARNVLLAITAFGGCGLWAAGTAKVVTLHDFRGTAGAPSSLTLRNGGAYGVSAQSMYRLSPPSAPGGEWTRTVLYDFGYGKEHLLSGVVFDGNGAAYGAEFGGCCWDLYQLTPPASGNGSWTKTVIYKAAITVDSDLPNGNLTWWNGALYGTNGQLVFQLSPPAAAGGTWTYTVLYDFGLSETPVGPSPGLAFDAGGNIYGATTEGGASGNGSVFELTPPASAGSAWTETDLYSFAGGSDGSMASSGVVRDSNGLLYGATARGGMSYRQCNEIGCGTVFQLTPPAMPGGAWTKTTLHDFAPGSDGAVPSGGLVADAGGALYGVTMAGGRHVKHCYGDGGQPTFTGCGVIFQIAPPAAPGGAASYNVIYRFSGGNDGWNPLGLSFDDGGTLTGLTGNYQIGYIEGGEPGANGSVFQLRPASSGGASSAWKLRVTYRFAHESDGDEDGGAAFMPQQYLTADNQGNLYSTTAGGGAAPRVGCEMAGCGTVLELSPPAKAGQPWKETILYEFKGGPDGSAPFGGVIFGNNGALYGVTRQGGSAKCPGGCGTLFVLMPPAKSGARWTKNILYNFAGHADGAQPASTLTLDGNGALYGTTERGGADNWGTVFQLAPPSAPGGAWSESVLVSFQGGNNDPGPSTIAFHNGALYGTVFGRISYHDPGTGVVFQLTPPAAPGGAWTETVLFRFGSRAAGTWPLGGLAFGDDGNIYGVTAFGAGTVYRLTPPSTPGAAWTQSNLYEFQGGTDGLRPSSLIYDNGVLYGTTYQHDNPGTGATIFQLTPAAGASGAWTHTTLYAFKWNQYNGTNPEGLLPLNGKLCGVSLTGGIGAGTIFEMAF